MDLKCYLMLFFLPMTENMELLSELAGGAHHSSGYNGGPDPAGSSSPSPSYLPAG